MMVFCPLCGKSQEKKAGTYTEVFCEYCVYHGPFYEFMDNMVEKMRMFESFNEIVAFNNNGGENMVKISDIYGGNYLKAETVKSENLVGKLLTIKDTRTEVFQKGDKVIVLFDEIEKELPLNKTNSALLADKFGDETAQWVSKKLTLVIKRKMYQGSLVDSIEVVPQ